MCKPNISQREFHPHSRDTKLDVSYRYLIPVDADALYLRAEDLVGRLG